MDSSKKPEKENPRKDANPISQLFIGWIIPMLFKGKKYGLNKDDLTQSLDQDCSTKLGNELEKNWENEIKLARRKNKEPKLRNALFKTFYKSCIIDGVLIFLFCLLKSFQPLVLAQLLIQFQNVNSTYAPAVDVINSTRLTEMHDDEATRMFEEDVDPSLQNESSDEAMVSIFQYFWTDVYCLTTLVVVLTLIPCFLMHHTDFSQRLVGARMRIACCSMIYRKTLKLSKKASSETSGGYMVNLLSNDVSRLDYGFIYAHYVWILPLQSGLICYLIWRKVGIAAFVGVFGLLLKTIPVQTGLSKLSSKLRMKVAHRTDARISIMNELIQGIQVIKMYAWEIPFQKVVASARKKEVNQIKYASYIRGIYLSTMVFTERSTLLISIATCVFAGQAISADIVFSMAQYFNILQLTAAIYYPMAVSFGAEALVSIQRIEEFLNIEEQNTTKTGLHKVSVRESPNYKSEVSIQNVSASWDDNVKAKTLKDISIEIKKRTLCAIIGPVGSGKSSLLQLLLGELPIQIGDVYIKDSVSYAAQEPWLFNASIRDNILFGQPYNKQRYTEVVNACALISDFQQLPKGDMTIVGERGAALSGGQKARVNLARAVYKEAKVYLLDDPLSAVDTHVGKHLFEKCINGYLAKQKATRILVTHQVHFLKDADTIVVLEEGGKIFMQGTLDELSKQNLDFGKLVQAPEPDDEVVEKPSVVDISDDEDDIPYIDGVSKSGYIALGSTVSLSRIKSKSLSVGNINAEDQAEGKVPYNVYKSYFIAGAGNCCILFLLLLIFLASQGVTSGSDYFVNFWTQQEYLRYHQRTTVFSTNECLYIYTGLIVCVIFMTGLRGFLFFNVCMNSSKKLHDRMFGSLLRAPMLFFDKNPSGRILNRFSRDMGSLDELLPKAMLDAIQVLLVMFGILTVISIVNPMLLVPLAITIFFFHLVLQLYLRSAQDFKRLEGISRSPVFSHLSATLSGLSTIRASEKTNTVKSEFDKLQDVHSAIWHLTMASNTALGLWLDCISTVFVACVAFSFIIMHERTFSGNVGLAISQALILTGMVQYGIRQTTETTQQMTSVERVLEYCKIENERNPTKKAPKDWPWKGAIEFKSMSLFYGDALPVLKDLNIEIKPTWKVGVVGRTGAGKSSLIAALFRLAKIEGKVLIDGIDTSVISLDSLRSQISIIPQDPVLFSATIRYNLDPFNKYEDDQIWKVLEAVEMKAAVHGLHSMVTEGGSNYSVGQRQLLCLARALLRGNKVLVLDEATANVDPQTDTLIQNTIRAKFMDCTVITVAHRLHTVMDSTRVIVMDNGRIQEYDIPHLLLQKEDGILRQMVDITGPQESESLKRIAADTFSNIQLTQNNLFDI